jgi:membrane fusion protein (multidrug efflux system)
MVCRLQKGRRSAIRFGDPAEIRVDALPGAISRGRVDHVASASGSQFALLPPDNFEKIIHRVPVKIIHRVPVKIVLDRDQPALDRLPPGLSEIAVVRTKATGE